MNLPVVDCMADPTYNLAWIRQGNGLIFSPPFFQQQYERKRKDVQKEKREQMIVLLIFHVYDA
jgi:hypothetical protein